MQLQDLWLGVEPAILKCISFSHSNLPYLKHLAICGKRVYMPNIIFNIPLYFTGITTYIYIYIYISHPSLRQRLLQLSWQSVPLIYRTAVTITSVLKSDYIKSIYTCTYYNTIIVSGLLPKPSAEFTGWELLYLNSEAHSYRIYTLKSQRNKPKLTLLEILMTNMNIDVICALRY